MFDTHCHLNFKRLVENLEEVIQSSKKAGVTHFVVPGTDIESSRKSIDIAQKYDGVYSAVGIHPHHVCKYDIARNMKHVEQEIEDLRILLDSCVTYYKLHTTSPIVAIGEIGLDRHEVGEEFIEAQKKLFVAQLDLAKKYEKSVIIHSRETTLEVLEILENNWDMCFEWRMVFHCCEPDMKMLDFALKHDVFIGVDGDITYFEEKQEFIKNVPLRQLVVETDAPFLLPEPLKSQKKYPNTPANLPLIVDFIAKLKGIEFDKVASTTHENGKRLFGIN